MRISPDLSRKPPETLGNPPETPPETLWKPLGNPSGPPLETFREPLLGPHLNPLAELFGIHVAGVGRPHPESGPLEMAKCLAA